MISAVIPKPKSSGRHSDAQCKGLYLQVRETGRASWLYRYSDKGREHQAGLGAYPLVSLADARAAALALRKVRHDGLDPLATGGAQPGCRRAARTFARGAGKQSRGGGKLGHRAGVPVAKLAAAVRLPGHRRCSGQRGDYQAGAQVLRPFWAGCPRQRRSCSRPASPPSIGSAAAARSRVQARRPPRWRDALACSASPAGRCRRPTAAYYPVSIACVFPCRTCWPARASYRGSLPSSMLTGRVRGRRGASGLCGRGRRSRGAAWVVPAARAGGRRGMGSRSPSPRWLCWARCGRCERKPSQQIMCSHQPEGRSRCRLWPYADG